MHDTPELDAKFLRQFGLLTGGIVAGPIRPDITLAYRACLLSVAVDCGHDNYPDTGGCLPPMDKRNRATAGAAPRQRYP